MCKAAKPVLGTRQKSSLLLWLSIQFCKAAGHVVLAHGLASFSLLLKFGNAPQLSCRPDFLVSSCHLYWDDACEIRAGIQPLQRA